MVTRVFDALSREYDLTRRRGLGEDNKNSSNIARLEMRECGWEEEEKEEKAIAGVNA
jgi:hypothetical protein